LSVPQKEERLQKVLADAGIGSRRECEKHIAQGRVAVDGKIITEMGVKVNPAEQRVTFDGKPIRAERKAYFLLNKPRHYVTTLAPEDAGRRAIDLLREMQLNLRPAGRLDKDSEGLIIFTNDGELINLLTHPSHQVTKTYLVRVEGRLDSEDYEAMKKGVFIAEGRAKVVGIGTISSSSRETLLQVVLKQGMNRQIRRMFAKLEHPVRQLVRVAIDGISDPKLKPGRYRRMTSTEVARLYAAAEAPAGRKAGARKPPKERLR